jgi:hypothetical protein
LGILIEFEQAKFLFCPGRRANRKTIETLIGHALKQGTITKPVTVDELFAKETLGLAG